MLGIIGGYMRQEAGQLMMVGVPGTAMTVELAQFMRRVRPAGVILFSRNVKSLSQLRSFIADLRSEGGNDLIISVDEEGGRVRRLVSPFPKLPPAAEYENMREPRASVKQLVSKAACEMAKLGIDLDFAPVLDVATNPKNPAIGDRAFSASAAVVADLGAEFIRALEQNGVGACGKHFPGHGDTDLDSHLALPVLRHSRARFDECELIPFHVAARMGVASIMTAHILVPALDPKFPASISKSIVTGLLRNEIGYRGLILTDDLEMKGISDSHPPEKSASMAISAGNDAVLVCSGDLVLENRVFDSISGAISSGELMRQQVESSISRIDEFRSRFSSSHESR